MAIYYRSGTGNSLLEAYTDGGAASGPAPLAGSLLYVNSKEFGFRNADGSVTYVSGKGFAYDASSGQFTGGTITLIRHYDASGAYIDDIKDFTFQLLAADFQAQLEGMAGSGSAGLAQLLFSGDDDLNGFYYQGTGTAAGLLLDGHDGNDIIHGSAFDDTLLGGQGNDMLIGNRGNDLVFGGAGNDELRGGAGQDQLYGDSSTLVHAGGRDMLFGGAGADYIDGGKGHDRLSGSKGADTLNGGVTGNDMLAGGIGDDTFVFALIKERFGSNWGNDIVVDFELGIDQLLLTAPDLGALTYANDADGHAVITYDAANTITLIGIDANTTTLAELLA
ncbi:calcium-binding protein [Aestuariivirga sp.]|uniref:calcium-binding protein n=1 Tax=Aestuariivirga sp. TaxID=2650926 RepID=UPI003593A117